MIGVQSTLDQVASKQDLGVGDEYKRCPKCGAVKHRNAWAVHLRQCTWGDDS